MIFLGLWSEAVNQKRERKFAAVFRRGRIHDLGVGGGGGGGGGEGGECHKLNIA